MANNRNAYQQTYNVSIPKKALLEIAQNDELKKKDLQVLLVLFTQLNGWTPTKSGRGEDPLNFKKIDIKSIADTLNLDKKDVKKSISKLVGEFLLEPGDSDTVKNGYRFSF